MTTTSERRFPAEWEVGGAVMIAWPHKDTDWAYMLDEIEQCYVALTEAITADSLALIVTPEVEHVRRKLAALPQDRLLIVEMQTNDTWVRDYGPLTVIDRGEYRLLDFHFNAWGGKFGADLDNEVNRKLREKGVFTVPLEDRQDFILEGGSVETDGEGALLTTRECLLNDNRNSDLTTGAIEAKLKDALCVDRVLWTSEGGLEGDDTDSHIDTLARFAPGHTILVAAPRPDDDTPQAQGLRCFRESVMRLRRPDGLPYNIVELSLPEPIRDPDDGHLLPATYANYLVTPTSLLVPSYGQPRNDELAVMTLRVAFPDHKIRQVDCRPLIRQHGSLHCATMQLPREVLPL